jgi:hypothetical protein
VRINGNKIRQSVLQLFIGFKKDYNLFRRDILYNTCILIESGIPVNLVSNETYSRVWVGKNLSDIFPIKNSLKQGDASSSSSSSSSLPFNFALSSGKPGWLEIKWYAPGCGLC